MSRSRDIANLLGSSSPIVDKTIVDAKGDLLVGSADNTVTKLTAGSTGQLPLVDSSTSSGLRYVDPPTNRNMIINGSMNLHQRATNFSGISSGYAYRTADRWATGVSGAGTWTQSIENDGPSGTGFSKSLKMLCTTANPSLTGEAICFIYQPVEGQNLQAIKKGSASAQNISISFWTKSNITGTFVIELVDEDNNRHIASTVSISSINTWEKKTIILPSDTTGPFDNDNNNSMSVVFWIAAGPTYSSGIVPSTWASKSNANRAAGTTNFSGTVNNYWQITGVQLEAGPVSTPFEFEPYETTLRKCQRYFINLRSDESSTGLLYFRIASGQNQSTTQAQFAIPLPVKMRTFPTLLQSATPSEFAVFANNVITSITSMGINSHPQVLNLTANVTSGLTSGQGSQLIVNNNRNAWLAFEAEL